MNTSLKPGQTVIVYGEYARVEFTFRTYAYLAFITGEYADYLDGDGNIIPVAIVASDCCMVSLLDDNKSRKKTLTGVNSLH